jgi:orotate phosphoribosyltransferase
LLTHEEIKQLFVKSKAFIFDSHIVYTSGKHGKAYVNKDALYPHTALTSLLCQQIALHFENRQIEAVLAPALGGIILSQWIAHHLTELSQREVLGVYAEKASDGESFVIKRGYDDLIRNKRVLIVEDILTTGISVKRVVETARQIPCDIIGVAALCNRGAVTASQIGNVPELFSLLQVTLETWEPSNCPMCQQNIPINTSIGKGKSGVSLPLSLKGSGH